jgi:hypothetical protein
MLSNLRIRLPMARGVDETVLTLPRPHPQATYRPKEARVVVSTVSTKHFAPLWRRVSESVDSVKI